MSRLPGLSSSLSPPLPTAVITRRPGAWAEGRVGVWRGACLWTGPGAQQGYVYTIQGEARFSMPCWSDLIPLWLTLFVSLWCADYFNGTVECNNAQIIRVMITVILK